MMQTEFIYDGTAHCVHLAYKFTGKERDAESGLDYFGARYYASTTGRWMSPDWAEKPEAVPYSSLSDPQSLNLYNYVGNNPLSKADPDGHCCWEQVLEAIGDSPAGEEISNTVEQQSNKILDIASAAIAATATFVATNAKAIGAANAQYYANGGGGDSAWAGSNAAAAKTPAATGNKAVPNPNGTKGAPDHQATADEEAAKLGGEREVPVKTPGGEKGSRRIDAANVDANGKVTNPTQVIRPNKNGTPPAREVRAARDIEKATGQKVTMVPVRPVPPQQ